MSQEYALNARGQPITSLEFAWALLLRIVIMEVMITAMGLPHAIAAKRAGSIITRPCLNQLKTAIRNRRKTTKSIVEQQKESPN